MPNLTRALLPFFATVVLLSGCGAPAPTSPTSQEGSGTDPVDVEATSEGWSLTGDAVLAAADADTALHECPPGEEIDLSRSVWGVGVYTGDSSVCLAAVHAGVFELGVGGVVSVTSEPGQDAYEGSTSNGVTTNEWGSWGTSFTVAAP